MLSRQHSRASRRLGILVLILVCFSTASCTSDNHKPVFPVRGQVFYQGRPAKGAVVFFHPQGAESEPESLHPLGVVGADGSFRLTTYRPDDGAPAGAYSVTVIWKSPSAHGDDDEKNLLPVRYMSPATSKLTAQVQQGTNDLPPYQLTK
jgi:hypothetical protein